VRLRLDFPGEIEFFWDPVIKRGNWTSRNGVFLGRIIHKWWTFHCCVWLEGRSAQNWGEWGESTDCFINIVSILVQSMLTRRKMDDTIMIWLKQSDS
jgi:hypothetical protein